MITELAGVREDPFAENVFDVCICGGGVAGITLALNLSARLNVLLLEAGGFEYSVDSQSSYVGENSGLSYPDPAVSRLRYFGGSSNHWEGDCRPLDSYDFKVKSYVSHSGWPIEQGALSPYLQAAERILDLPDPGDWSADEGVLEDAIAQSAKFQNAKFKVSAPTRFGEKYRKPLRNSKNVHCYLDANVTDLVLAENADRLSHVVIRDPTGRNFRARARAFVLATGGIENARILLNSDKQVPQGLGNRQGLIGRFFADHMYTKVADFILEDDVRVLADEYPFGRSFKARLKGQVCQSPWALETIEYVRGTRPDCLSEIRHAFAPRAGLMEQEEILNFSLRLFARTPGHGQATDGKVFIAAEQAPNPQSRITLGPEVDSNGLRRVNVNWDISDIDLYTIRRGAYRFGEAFAEQGLGRLKIVNWLYFDSGEFRVEHGHHHMCTTRMGSSPEDGAVDTNQKLFGTDNLYIAGSSTFSTGGHANPTLTIVQMTLRLADHMNRVLAV
jgi:choline dehydrogenase-like flavoprotein